ncbi:MAG: hypothetical protein J7559_18735 [Cohnella sp.]|nr:hypothetical protein [Cohnella sp.]
MDVAFTFALVGAAAAVSGIMLGWAARTRTIREDVRKDASSGAILHTDVEYIKRGVDDIRLEQRAQGQRIDVLAERVTRIEESVKQAHKRLDHLYRSDREE